MKFIRYVTAVNWALLGFSWVLLGFGWDLTKFYPIFLGFTGFGVSLILFDCLQLGCNGFYWVVTGFHHSVTLNFTGFY